MKPKTLKRAIWAVFTLNLLDATTTIGLVKQKMAEEANPLMALALSLSVFSFLAIKILWVGLNLVLFWLNRRSPWVFLIWIPLSVFACLFVYEVVFFCLSL